MPDRFSIESDLLPRLVDRGELRARRYDGFFLDIGVPETFASAQVDVPAQRRRPAIFFDRDGVLNHDDNYVGSADRFRWIDGAKDAVRMANDHGYYVFVVTNQAGVARGFYGEEDVRSLHRWIAADLRESGAWVDDWRFCPFHLDAAIEAYRGSHPWRKPEPGMLLDLMDHWPVDRERSLLIGDQESDLAAAKSAGVRAEQFTGGNLREFLAEQI
jgi:D-glycero-D-manno-heptose 1,7-bisphosphate phosphatase